MTSQVFLNGAPVVGFGAAPALETAFYVSPIVGFVGGAFGGYYLAGMLSKSRGSAAFGTAIGGVTGAFVAPQIVHLIGRSS